MSKHVIERGEVYWINPNPSVGREIKGRHRFVVITPKAINLLGSITTVPVTSGGNFSRITGVTVPISGHDTIGVALCNQVYAYDINARIKAGTAKYIETLDQSLVDEILDRVVSILDPEELR